MIVNKNIGLYIHVPFCRKKCPYCDFYSINYGYKGNIETHYFDSVNQELLSYKKDLKKRKKVIDTIYIGGGTPSIVNLSNIKNILKTIRKNFKIKKPEITIEVNPKDCDEPEFKYLKKIGINRLSFGMQSANDSELYILGRKHSFLDLKSSIEMARQAEFKNISVDIMLGIPYQTINELDKTLNKINELDIQHVSAYLIKIEKDTVFNKQSVIDKLPSEDDQEKLYLHTVKVLDKMGFTQYEISNFSKIGYESKHNKKYWDMQEYIGIGPTAHSYYNDQRYSMERNIYKYINMKDKRNFIYQYQDKPGDINEYLMIKLRTTIGININEMNQIYPQILVNEILYKIKKYCDSRCINIIDGYIRLTPQGFIIFNSILTNLMLD